MVAEAVALVGVADGEGLGARRGSNRQRPLGVANGCRSADQRRNNGDASVGIIQAK